jgi:predicted DNA-binding ribbon-helix-helix protein
MGRELQPSGALDYEGRTEPATTLVNRNVRIAGHRTSIRLEPAMWSALHEVCLREHASMHDIATRIAGFRSESSMTAAIRVYLLEYFHAAATDDGHRSAGHGAVARRYGDDPDYADTRDGRRYDAASGAPL